MSSNNCNSLCTPVKRCNHAASVSEANSDVTSTVEERSNSCPSSSLACSDGEALSAIDKLKRGNSCLSFVTLQTLVQSRQMNENNAQHLYSVLESINNCLQCCIRRKEQFQKEHQEATKTMKKERQNVLLKISVIENIFTLVSDIKILNCFNDEPKNFIHLLNAQINELSKVEVEGRNNGSSSSTYTANVNVNNLVEKLKDVQKEKETLLLRLTASRAYEVELRAKRERQREAYKREMFVLLHELQRVKGRLNWRRGVEDMLNYECRKRKRG